LTKTFDYSFVFLILLFERCFRPKRENKKTNFPTRAVKRGGKFLEKKEPLKMLRELRNLTNLGALSYLFLKT